MQEVSGSIPLTSTNQQHPEGNTQPPSSRGLGHRPFTAVTGVRIPVGTPYIAAPSSANSPANTNEGRRESFWFNRATDGQRVRLSEPLRVGVIQHVRQQF